MSLNTLCLPDLKHNSSEKKDRNAGEGMCVSVCVHVKRKTEMQVRACVWVCVHVRKKDRNADESVWVCVHVKRRTEMQMRACV